MALAALCSRLKQHPFVEAQQFPGFGTSGDDGLYALVVDHGAREGSAAEAHAVSEALQQRGKSCSLLPRSRLTSCLKVSGQRF